MSTKHPWESEADPEVAETVSEPEDLTEEEWLQKVVDLHNLQAQIKELTAYERDLRTDLSAHYFDPNKEGTQYHDMPQDWRLKAEFKINRRLDEAALPAVLAKMPEGAEEGLIRYKPELKVGPYKKLHANQRQILDEAVIAKPGLPTLTLVPPKEKKS